ncbi:MAG: hypothetical protein QOF51_1831 [Chloroflexota bacterium]|nr:hypothetical protein [Chloroflexota bacterium]
MRECQVNGERAPWLGCTPAALRKQGGTGFRQRRWAAPPGLRRCEFCWSRPEQEANCVALLGNITDEANHRTVYDNASRRVRFTLARVEYRKRGVERGWPIGPIPDPKGPSRIDPTSLGPGLDQWTRTCGTLRRAHDERLRLRPALGSGLASWQRSPGAVASPTSCSNGTHRRYPRCWPLPPAASATGPPPR